MTDFTPIPNGTKVRYRSGFGAPRTGTVIGYGPRSRDGLYKVYTVTPDDGRGNPVMITSTPPGTDLHPGVMVNVVEVHPDRVEVVTRQNKSTT